MRQLSISLKLKERQSWKSDNYRENSQEKKQRTDTKNKAKNRNSDNLKRGTMEKPNIAIAVSGKSTIG